MKRVIFDILIFLFIFLFPWWVSAIFAILGLFIFIEFYEFILISIIIYSLYTVPNSGFMSSLVVFPVIVFVIYIMIQSLRKYIILYKNEISY